jgi:preprotein translocase subunit SecA
MNEQRKVIYKRRQQILDGEDLRQEAEEAITSAIGRLVDQYAVGSYSEEWDVAGLIENAKSYYPTQMTKEQIDEAVGREMLEQMMLDDALAIYNAKEEAIGAESLRDIERRVLLSVIDQHWREHLYEMDYLQEGINLRAMGQQDPLAEWQREGFDMFEAMMGQIEDDFVRYVFHLQVVVDEEPRQNLRNVSYSAPTDPSESEGGIAAAMAASPELPGEPPEMWADDGGMQAAAQAMPVQTEAVQQQPVRVEKTPGRNDPCFCGSGKKYKVCHGR